MSPLQRKDLQQNQRGLSLVSLPFLRLLYLRQRKKNPLWRVYDVTLPPIAANVLTGGLSEEEQLALAVKASLDTIREERAAWVASLMYN